MAKADDWRKYGDVVRERGRQFISEFAKHDLGKRPDPRICILSMPVSWLAVGFVGAYDPTQFDYVRWLRSIPNLGYRDEPKNGRPRGDASRAAATMAYYFYEAWRGENQKREINDYGHRREMKDFAAQAVVDDIFALQFMEPKLNWQFGVDNVEAFIEIVRGLMEKPKKRRDPGDDYGFDLLATPTGLLLHLPPKPTSKS